MSRFDEVDFTPASQVPRTANYRSATGRAGANGGGVRVGMPEDPNMNLDENPDAQEEVLGADDLPVMGVTSLGAMLMQNGQVDMSDITGGGRRQAGHTRVPEAMVDNMSFTDRYDDGTPGGGTPIENPNAVEANRLLSMAERAERNGNHRLAASLADTAEQLLAEAEDEDEGFDGFGSTASGFGQGMGGPRGRR